MSARLRRPLRPLVSTPLADAGSASDDDDEKITGEFDALLAQIKALMEKAERDLRTDQTAGAMLVAVNDPSAATSDSGVGFAKVVIEPL